MKKLTALLWGILMISLTACDNESVVTDSQTDSEDKALILSESQKTIAGIKTGKLEKRLMAEVIECTGFIDVPPTNIATVHAPIAGIVRKINAIAGIKVKKGETLVVLTDPAIANIQEEYLYVDSKTKYLETEFARKKKLYDQEAISEKEYLESENEYELSKFKLEGIREQLELLGISTKTLETKGISSSLNITAPFDGYVSDVFVNTGTYTEANNPLLEVINYDHVHLALSVYSNTIGKVVLGQTVRFTLAGTEKGGWGTIQLIGKKVDEESKSILVHAHIDSHETSLTIGSSIMAELLVDADSAFCLPEAAIIGQRDKTYLFVEKNGAYERRNVLTGRNFDGFVEVLNTDELKGENIVISGAYYLAD
ncbi:MAG: efflux RND transporter periplasmic adaptor subunit [bacterium]